MKEKEWKKWIFWFSFVVAAIIVYKTIDSVSHIFLAISNFLKLLMPFIIAALLAYILYIPAKSIERRYKKSKSKFVNRHARGLSTVAVYIGFVTFIIIVINFIMPAISTSVKDLASNLPTYYNNAIEFLANLPKDSVVSKLNLLDIIKNLETIDVVEEILNWFNLENISQYIKGIVGATGVIFDLFVVIVVSVYLLLERNDIKKFLKDISAAIFDKKVNEKITDYANKANKIFFTFITSQVFDAFIVGTVTSIVMSIMGIKYGVLLGFFIGLFNVIPYFGAIVAVIVSVIITIFTGGIGQAIWLAIVVIILQQIDANIINPKILGTTLNLSPILVIFAVTVGGAYFGVLGMFLGVPVCALIKLIINDMIENKKRDKNEDILY